jgi:hypothetical protein
MPYDTVLLGTFVAVCGSGSFTKAAREVNLTQSAVSLHVKRLEDQVGSRLIVRNMRGVRLTEQARCCCPTPGGSSPFTKKQSRALAATAAAWSELRP